MKPNGNKILNASLEDLKVRMQKAKCCSKIKRKH